jgi:nicotinate-nucleotide adenylyltransferase
VNVAVFGGSFNPPHVAHVLACRVVAERDDVDRVLVVPAFRHPFAKELAPFDDRVTMCELAMRGLPQVDVSRIEEELGGESRTLRTLESLATRNPTWHLRLVIGADILAETPKWFGFDAIKKLAPPIVLGRVGVDAQGVEPSVLPAVSSTAVREAVARSSWDEVERLVPADVAAYIRQRGLYASHA